MRSNKASGPRSVFFGAIRRLSVIFAGRPAKIKNGIPSLCNSSGIQACAAWVNRLRFFHMRDEAHSAVGGRAAGPAHADGAGHSHAHLPADFGRAFALGTSLNVAYVVIQVIFGMLAHSLALLSDAGH